MQKRKKKPFDSYFIPHDHFICPSPWSSKHGSSVCGSPPPPPSLFTHHSLLLTSLSLREIIVGVCEEGGARTRWWLCDR